MESVTKRFKDHYESTFSKFGASSKGVDWGKDEDVVLRYENMLSVIREDVSSNVSILDVGCGYGGLLEFARKQGVSMHYTGIDVAENMVSYARNHFTECEFLIGDVLHYDFDQHFDYVVCNGILTQKLAATNREMDEFANALILKMFELCNSGIAYNIMSNKVNFMVENLYYRSPIEMLEFCLNNISTKVRIDHAYPIYEYTVYAYRD